MENTLISVPAQRPESINDILNTLKRYDAFVIRDLQDYLQSQITDNFQDINSNLALLKLYELVNSEVNAYEETEYHTIQILLKGLINFTYQDFQLYLNLLPSYTIINEEAPFVNSLNEKVQKLISVYNVLVSSNFAEFWNIFNNDPSFKDEIVSKYYDSAENLKYNFQRSIATLISITYKSIDLTLLSKILDFSDSKQATEFVTDLKWTVKDSKVIIYNPNLREEEKIVNFNTETIKFEQIDRLIRKAFEN